MLTDERCGVRVADVREVEEPLRGLLAGLEPDEVFVFDAPDLWAAFDAGGAVGDVGEDVARAAGRRGVDVAAGRVPFRGGAAGERVGHVGGGGAGGAGDVEAGRGAAGDG